MDSIIKKQRIASLILKEKIDELSKSEKEELTSWLQASPRNEEIYSRLQKKEFQRGYCQIPADKYHPRFGRLSQTLRT